MHLESPLGIFDLLSPVSLPCRPPSHLIRMDDTAFPPSIPMAAPHPTPKPPLAVLFLCRCFPGFLLGAQKRSMWWFDSETRRTEWKGRALIHAGYFTTPGSVPLTAQDLCIDTAADATDNGVKLNELLTCHISSVRTNLSHPIAKGHHLEFDWLNAQ